MSVDSIAEKIAAEYKNDPRNKVFVDEEGLIASVLEETGEEVVPEKIRNLISAYQESGLDDDEQLMIYDGMVYICGVVAKKCFANDPEDEDEEVDYELSWIRNDDNSYTAQIRHQ